MHTLASVAGPTQDYRSSLVTVESELVLTGDTAMYPREWDADGKTIHSRDCLKIFARRDLRCPRCVELAADAEPKHSSHRTYLLNKLGREQRRLPLLGGF